MSYYRPDYPPMPKKIPPPPGGAPMSHTRKDPFRTLDDPEPAPAAGELIAVDPVAAGGTITSSPLLQEAHSLGYWQMWPAGRPAWWRRALVRLVLGWKWRE